MACYRPLTGWWSKFKNSTGKRSLVFSASESIRPEDPLKVPCGQCIGCRLERSRNWAVRCMHESSLHSDNCFITLTFDTEHLMQRQNPWSVDVRDIQLFMKKLRNRYPDKSIRYLACGEYGENNKRPHYHLLLFNHDFADKQLWRDTGAYPLWVSAELAKLWPYGFNLIGNVTFDTCSYVAKYVVKKVNGDDAKEHYTRIVEETGELVEVKPEFLTMSRRPAIAKDWFDKYGSDVVNNDNVVINGRIVRPPKYYDVLAENEYSQKIEYNKRMRIVRAMSHPDEYTYERLDAKEQCALAKFNSKKRNI